MKNENDNLTNFVAGTPGSVN